MGQGREVKHMKRRESKEKDALVFLDFAYWGVLPLSFTSLSPSPLLFFYCCQFGFLIYYSVSTKISLVF